MEAWQNVFSEGIAPQLSNPCMVALYDGLAANDPCLIQGATTSPPPLQCVIDWPVEAGCVLCYAGWKGEGLTTVGEVEEFFARTCFEADNRMGEQGAIRWFLNWFDDTPRSTAFALLTQEVAAELMRRGTAVKPAA